MSSWQQTTLGEIVRIGGGRIQTGPFGSQLHASDYVDVGIPCIMPTNMKNNRINLFDIAFISEKDAKRLSKHLVQEGDIVYSRRGDVTQKALIQKSETGYFCGTGCLLVRPGKAIDAEFLTYHLGTPINQAWIVKQAVGATMPNLNTGILSDVPLNVPGKEVQQKIAAVLSALDAKIDCNNRINAELEAMAKTLYDYWFVQFDFPDANGKPYKSSGGKMVYNATLKREIPAGWEAKCFAELGRFKNGINYDPSVGGSSAAQIVNVRNVSATSIFIKENDLDVLNLDQNDIDKYLVTSDSILIARSGIPGATRMMAHCPPNTIYCGFIISLKVANPDDKLFLFFRLKQIEQSLLSQSSGSILKNVSQDTLKEIRIAMPPDGGRSVIEAFNTALNPILGKLNFNHQENQQLAQLRDWLLPLLMNGQVTVA